MCLRPMHICAAPFVYVQRRLFTCNAVLFICSAVLFICSAVCLCAAPFVYVQRRFVYMQRRLFMCSAVCLYAAPFVYMQRRLFICSAVCLYAAPAANLQSGVQICKATCSCARVGFRKHVVFSMTHKSQAPDEFIVARRVAARISVRPALSGPAAQGEKRTAAHRSCALQTKLFPKMIR